MLVRSLKDDRVSEDTIIAAQLNPFGGLSGAYWPVSPAPLEQYGDSLKGAVSDDGAVLLLDTYKAFSLQRLDAAGVPTGVATILKRNGSLADASFDITNPSQTGRVLLRIGGLARGTVVAVRTACLFSQ